MIQVVILLVLISLILKESEIRNIKPTKYILQTLFYILGSTLLFHLIVPSNIPSMLVGSIISYFLGCLPYRNLKKKPLQL
jgi:hypothetical protein